MRLTLFPLLACLFALMDITFMFFFFLIKYGVAAFLSTLIVHVGVGDLACWRFLFISLGLRLALVRLMSFFVT
jgi:hypothetical protein